MWWKRWSVWTIISLIVAGIAGSIIYIHSNAGKAIITANGGVTETESDAVKVGKELTANHCSGSGTVPLDYAPMKPEQISVIEPYGLTVGGHVTPVDHQYYWAKNNIKDTNDVLALADGTLAGIQYRSHNGQGPVAGDYRVVISYTCTFMSYFDLATSLAPDIAAKLPSGWESKGSTDINIPVKAGQVIAKMGGQSLDFAVWDTTKNNPKLLAPLAYTAESWKIHTVAPLDYFADAVKASILPFYARKEVPQDGYYAYDIEGKLIGSWFLKGSGGYNTVQAAGATTYWGGHLTIAPDFIDPTVIGFSIGDYLGEATQFIIKPPVADLSSIGVDSGLIKFQLLHVNRYLQPSGKEWDGLATPAGKLTMQTNGTPIATALVQLTDPGTLKVELFTGKTPGQVTGFDSAAKIYTRSGL